MMSHGCDLLFNCKYSQFGLQDHLAKVVCLIPKGDTSILYFILFFIFWCIAVVYDSQRAQREPLNPLG
jgi:hypothetical protein